MFFATEAGLVITRARAYDPELGRWLSRDPLRKAEEKEGPNLYAYAANNPVNFVDPMGLCCEVFVKEIERLTTSCIKARAKARADAIELCHYFLSGPDHENAAYNCDTAKAMAEMSCKGDFYLAGFYKDHYEACLQEPCDHWCLEAF
jgi:RHS repeat-associated protein